MKSPPAAGPSRASPTTVAIYAPQAYGAEYILIKDGVDLKPAYALHLDRSR